MNSVRYTKFSVISINGNQFVYARLCGTKIFNVRCLVFFSSFVQLFKCDSMSRLEAKQSNNKKKTKVSTGSRVHWNPDLTTCNEKWKKYFSWKILCFKSAIATPSHQVIWNGSEIKQYTLFLSIVIKKKYVLRQNK